MPKCHRDADQAAQAGTAVKHLLTSQAGQIAPVLQNVDAQHALQTDGRPAVARLGVVRLDHGASLLPGNDAIHRLRKHFASHGHAVVLEVLIDCHCQRLLCHDASSDALSMSSMSSMSLNQQSR